MSEGDKEESRDGVGGRSAVPVWAEVTEDQLHRVQHAIADSDPRMGYIMFWCEHDGGDYDDSLIIDGQMSTRALVQTILKALATPATGSTGDSETLDR